MEIARILIYGDLHLSSKNYGAHRDYPKDSLESLRKVTREALNYKPTHIIGLGDFTYGRFNSLEYRSEVEKELETQYNITDGRRYELKGNHDSASYGMTEFEYYILKGMIKPATNLTIGDFHFTMVNYGEHKETVPNIGDENSTNFLLMHDYFKFQETNIPDYGKAIELDHFENWYGVDYIIGGHIHNSEVFEGLMLRQESDGQTHGHKVLVDYLGSMSRPAYREGHTDEVGHILEITLYDNGEFKYDRLDIELPPLAETFNLDAKEVEKAKQKAKENRVDISDVVHQLDSHKRSIGNPEDIIASLEGIDDKYKNKAIELLKLGQA